MTITATFPGRLLAAGIDRPGRRIGGVAVPWNVEGRVSSGELVVFHPGSLDATRRPPALRDHDRTRPIGVVADAADTGTHLEASIAVSAVRLGDESLVLASDGALMFSVGADPTRFDYDARGVMHVHAADWHELSLLPIGAYTGAVITQVAASSPTPEANTVNPTLSDTPDVDDPDAPELPDAPEPDDDEAGDDVETHADVVPIAITAARGRHPAQARRRNRYDQYGLRDVARLIAASRGGDPARTRARDLVLAAQGPIVSGIEAALADITMVGADNVAAMYRPAYQAELVDIISWGTPLIDALRQGDLERGDYPNKSFNSWTKTPEVAIQTAEKTEIHSVPAKITPTAVPVQTWAGGNDISQQTLDFGSPSFVEDYIRAAGIDYAQQSDTYAVTALLAAAAPVTTVAGDTFLTVLQKLLGGLSPATTPPGGLFVCVSQDVGVGLIGVQSNDGPAFWDGHIQFGAMPAEMTVDSGLSVFVDPDMPARTYLAGHKQGATWYDLPGTPFNLRAVNVGLLGLDIAVYGYGALGIQYPGAFTKTTQPAV